MPAILVQALECICVVLLDFCHFAQFSREESAKSESEDADIFMKGKCCLRFLLLRSNSEGDPLTYQRAYG